MVQAGEIFFDDNHDNSPETEFAGNIKEGVVVTEDNSNDEREPKILARFWQLEQIEKAQKDGGSNAVAQLFRDLGKEDAEIAFPRLAVPWQETSYGRRTRIEVLADNPYFASDVKELRSWLGIPPRLFEVTGEARSFVEKRHESGFEKNEAIVQTQPQCEPLPDDTIRIELLDIWVNQYFHGRTTADNVPKIGFLKTLLESADAAAEAWKRVHNRPDWIKNLAVDEVADPVLEVARTLIRRHRLPAWVTGWVWTHVVTGDSGDLVSIPVDWVDVSAGEYEYQEDGCDLTVYGVDEYMTKTRWLEIFDRFVEPIVQKVANKRGNLKAPASRTSADEYKKYMNLLWGHVEGREPLSPESRVARGLPKLSRTAESRIRDLKILLTPQDPDEV